jgi:hypothetical protein
MTTSDYSWSRVTDHTELMRIYGHMSDSMSMSKPLTYFEELVNIVHRLAELADTEQRRVELAAVEQRRVELAATEQRRVYPAATEQRLAELAATMRRLEALSQYVNKSANANANGRTHAVAERSYNESDNVHGGRTHHNTTEEDQQILDAVAASITEHKSTLAHTFEDDISKAVAASKIPVFNPLDHMDRHQLRIALVTANNTLATIGVSDPIAYAFAASNVDRIRQLILEKAGSNELAQMIVKYSNSKIREIIGPINEPVNQHCADLRIVGNDKNRRKYFVYADGTVSSATSLIHTCVVHLLNNGSMIEFVESNKCFFVQIWKFYADHWVAMGIMSPSALLMEFRKRGGSIHPKAMMNDLIITKFVEAFSLTLRVNIIDLNLDGVIDYSLHGVGKTVMYSNLHESGNHYINGAE